MEFIEKVKEVRKDIKLCSEYYDYSSEFSYGLKGLFCDHESKECITPEEHKDIARYLDYRGEIELAELKNGGFLIDILSFPEPIIRLKSLKLLSAELKDYYTGLEIIDLLKENGVDKRLLVYPETKWIIFYKVFSELVTSNNQKDKNLLFKIIGESLHPVNLGGDIERSKQLQSKYSDIFKYDGFVINDLKIEKISKKDNFDNNNEKRKTSIDYIRDVLNFFKTEYNKVKLKGLSYEYCLGEAFSGLNEIEYSEECEKNLKAIEQLEEAGFIVEHRIYNNSLDNGIWVMVICKIDEDAITEESPKATNRSVKDFVQKIEIVSGSMKVEGLKDGLEKISQDKISTENKSYSMKTRSKDKEKLRFYSDTGDISYKEGKGEIKEGSKGFVILSFLGDKDNKNTPFTIDDITTYCNPLVNKESHYFKKEKEIDDTIRLIKSKLNVGKNAYFPIEKKGSKNKKKWVWVEK